MGETHHLPFHPLGGQYSYGYSVLIRWSSGQDADTRVFDPDFHRIRCLHKRDGDSTANIGVPIGIVNKIVKEPGQKAPVIGRQDVVLEGFDIAFYRG